MTRLAEAKLLEAHMHGTDNPQCQSMQMSCSKAKHSSTQSLLSLALHAHCSVAKPGFVQGHQADHRL